MEHLYLGPTATSGIFHIKVPKALGWDLHQLPLDEESNNKCFLNIQRTTSHGMFVLWSYCH